jgi:Arc/MetJ-type ribon-helix-helix transcriptional regulator
MASPPISIRLPADHLEAVDALVAAHRFPDRSAAIRSAIVLLLRRERERATVDSRRKPKTPSPLRARFPQR